MDRIADGFALAEAPVVTAADELLVSDVLHGGIRRFAADGTELDPLDTERRGVGGMGVLPDGSVVASGRDLVSFGADGSAEVVVARPDGGTGFNDLTVTADGTVIAGLLTCRPMGGDELTPALLVLRGPDGTVSSAPLPFCWPNGVEVSPAGDLLYFADFATGVVHRSPWPVGSAADVHLEPWFTSPSGDADGLALGDDGHVWVASGVGRSVLRVDASATVVDELAVPDDFVSSCAWWPRHERLVVTTGSAVFFHEIG